MVAYYDVWVPGAAPSEALSKRGKHAGDDDARWKAFTRQYQREMKTPAAARLLDLLAALSHVTDLSVGATARTRHDVTDRYCECCSGTGRVASVAAR